jgi:hypothetical protein
MYIIGKTGVTGPWASPEDSRSRENEQLVPCFLFDERLDVSPEQGKQGGGGAAGAEPGDSLGVVALRGTQVASRGATDKQSYARNGPKRPTWTSRETVIDREACIVILIIQLVPKFQIFHYCKNPVCFQFFAHKATNSASIGLHPPIVGDTFAVCSISKSICDLSLSFPILPW